MLKTKKRTSDAKLWKVFSEYIRLKNSDENGYCQCYTCPRIAFYKEMDCGHGIGRQHKATKFDEKNNKPQCGRCNAFEGGRREIFKQRMDKEHGPGTWDLLELRSKSPSHWSQFEFDILEKHYKAEVKKLKQEKGL